MHCFSVILQIIVQGLAAAEMAPSPPSAAFAALEIDVDEWLGDSGRAYAL
jgi:hypothetical protein